MNALKYRNQVLVSLFFIVVANFANARGGIDSGGGRGVVCRNTNGEITSAKMLDLYEGEIVHKLRVTRTDQPWEAQLSKALDKLPESVKGVRFYVEVVKKNFNLLPDDAMLPSVDDSFEFVLPRNCKVEQLAVFYSPENIQVDGQIWSKLGETDKAALILHEGIYWLDRIGGGENSRRSRRMTATLMSDNTPKLEDPRAGVPSNALKCIGDSEDKTQNSWFYAYPFEGRYRLQFVSLAGQFVYSKKTFDFSPENLGSSEFPPKGAENGTDRIGTSTKISAATTANIEGGEFLTFGLERAKFEGAPITWNKLTLEGHSPWDPKRVFKKAYVYCSADNQFP